MHSYVKAKPVLFGLLTGIIGIILLWITLFLLGKNADTIGLVPVIILVIVVAGGPGFVAARKAGCHPYLHGGVAGLAFIICALIPLVMALLFRSEDALLIFAKFGGAGRAFWLILTGTFSGVVGAAFQQKFFQDRCSSNVEQ